LLGGVRFAADGVRLGKTSVERAVYAQRGTDRLWSVGYTTLALLAADGTVVREIPRAPDGKWLRNIGGAGVAPDGSIALSTWPGLSAPTTGDDSAAIHLYDAGGEPVRSFAAPEGITIWAPFAFDGQRLAIGVEEENKPGSVVLMDAHGNTLGRFTPEGAVPLWHPFFAAHGKELWLFDGERTLERFALP